MAPKHSLSPAPLPPSKRIHTDANTSQLHGPKLSFDSALYDELILYIFSHLSWVDLCATQHTSKNWARLAADNELWRLLYLQVYGRPRLRGLRGFISRMDGKEVKPLPGRAKVDETHRDWKWMFRISSNWKIGRCLREELNEVYSSPSSNTLIQLAGSLSVTASTDESLRPTLYVHDPSSSHRLHCISTRKDAPTHAITALAIDQSAPISGHIRLAAFLDTGEFTVYDVPHTNLAASKPVVTYAPRLRTDRTAPIIQAVYHHPLLLSLSHSFSLSVYDLSSDNVVHTHTLSTFTSFPPTSMVLSTPTSHTYKLVLTYAIPVYPAHWSVGATELMISSARSTMSVIATRSARALDTPQGWIDENKLKAMREQWARKVIHVADTQTDGKWVVLAPGDSTALSSHTNLAPQSAYTNVPSMHSPVNLQLYRLSLPNSSNPSSLTAPQPKLTFVRNLSGQTGPISSLSLADGRCVSLGVNGSIWVWDLEAGTVGAEVAPPRYDPMKTLEEASQGDFERRGVVFDERRIVSAEGGRVVVRRFDI